MITNLNFFSTDSDNKKLVFEYFNSFADIDDLAKSCNVNAFDGIEWLSENKTSRIKFKGENVCQVYFAVESQKIFVLYEGISDTHPSPNNLIAFNSEGEIDRIFSPPYLPNGKRAAGFLQINDLKGRAILKNEHTKDLEVVVWEDERSYFVYHYFLSPFTYILEFEKTSRQ